MQALEQGIKLYVLVIDDAEFMDAASWNFIHNLCARYDVMVIMCTSLCLYIAQLDVYAVKHKNKTVFNNGVKFVKLFV